MSHCRQRGEVSGVGLSALVYSPRVVLRGQCGTLEEQGTIQNEDENIILSFKCYQVQHFCVLPMA